MIEIRNFTTNPVKEGFIRRVTEKILEKEKIKGHIEISIAFVGEGRMQKLNKEYREKNRVTDVLAFGGEFQRRTKEKKRSFVKTPNNVIRLGEVVICLRQAKKQAKEYGHSTEKELAILLIHGILHLLGYDHERGKSEAEEMKKKEDEILMDSELSKSL